MNGHAKHTSSIALGLICCLAAFALLLIQAQATESAGGTSPGTDEDGAASSASSESGAQTPAGTAEDDATASISVGRMLFCRSIKDREPQEAAGAFPNDIEKVYCFTVIENAGAEATHVTHKWYWGDKLMASVQLKAQGEYWRTWSIKHMQPEWTGPWRVDVVSADGKVLKTARFQITEPGAETGLTGDDADSEETGEDAKDKTNEDGAGTDTNNGSNAPEKAGDNAEAPE